MFLVCTANPLRFWPLGVPALQVSVVRIENDMLRALE